MSQIFIFWEWDSFIWISEDGGVWVILENIEMPTGAFFRDKLYQRESS